MIRVTCPMIRVTCYMPRRSWERFAALRGVFSLGRVGRMALDVPRLRPMGRRGGECAADLQMDFAGVWRGLLLGGTSLAEGKFKARV